MTREEFIELGIKFLSNQTSESELNRFNYYLQEKNYCELFEELKKEWETDLNVHSEEFNLERGIYKLRVKIAGAKGKKSNPVLRRRVLIAGLAAAAIFLGAIINGIFFFNPFKIEAPLASVKYVTVEAKRGERKEIQLPDGSHVYLNSESVLRYPGQFATNSRNIEMKGEAFFKVTENPKRPFVINANNFQIKVLGTSFNVLSESTEQIQVTVEIGKVRVSKDDQLEVYLQKGDQVEFDPFKNVFRKSETFANVYTDWTRNILRFDAIPVDEAIGRMEKWYNVKIGCQSPKLRSRIVRGVYQNESLESVLENIKFLLGIEYAVKGDSIIIHN